MLPPTRFKYNNSVKCWLYQLVLKENLLYPTILQDFYYVTSAYPGEANFTHLGIAKVFYDTTWYCHPDGVCTTYQERDND